MQNTTQHLRVRQTWIGLCLQCSLFFGAHAQQVLTIATYPSGDEIVRSVVP